ncbi:hypothetical protein GBN24_11980 [Plesiomonas shigelloides]|uniref:hypothetical protein n=1 Tax=Plesiomonas shigelloides TaxID=703 RepID=UPI0012618C49|nr:hypothetical protein [Plesiomonas shigelloides]KAB7688992.1 hypothetical protein GBN24_11980 [Plesiomonas shigelloides]
MDIISILGTIVGCIGLIVAFWQYRKTKSLEDNIRAHNWFMYQRVNNTNGTTQIALDLYKKRHQSGIDLDVLEQLARADSCGQELFKEIIKQIHMHEPSFTEKDFERWKREGKLSDSKFNLFLQFSTDAEMKVINKSTE